MGIPAVDRKIIARYRESGGPEPAPINHQGIDDALLEKPQSHITGTSENS
jgi:hypothetical protein